MRGGRPGPPLAPPNAKIGPAAGIGTTDDLLEQCCSPAGRKAIAEKSGVNEKMLLEWTNMADLMRVSGVGRQYAELLEAAGVDTIKELRNRNAENLAVKMKEVNDEKNLTRKLPSADQVAGWVTQAKELGRKIEY